MLDFSVNSVSVLFMIINFLTDQYKISDLDFDRAGLKCRPVCNSISVECGLEAECYMWYQTMYQTNAKFVYLWRHQRAFTWTWVNQWVHDFVEYIHTRDITIWNRSQIRATTFSWFQNSSLRSPLSTSYTCLLYINYISVSISKQLPLSPADKTWFRPYSTPSYKDTY